MTISKNPLLDGSSKSGSGAGDPDNYDINKVRAKLVETQQMAFPTLCYTALEHASEGVTHSDQKIKSLLSLKKEDYDRYRESAWQLARDMKDWVAENKVKSFLMFAGLGGTAFKAKTIGQWMKDKAQSFIDLGLSYNNYQRFVLFVGLMTVRLVVSTVVPPTSPGFGIILQAATPPDDKWTAMPLFLLASTAAGAVPYLLDKVLQLIGRKDFIFTTFMHDFAAMWPLTCWTKPAMEKVFHGAGGGKIGASTAVIVAHAAPFMGAQTTMMQRYFLPHPLDTILSQPFGMSEDLISMAMAEATSNPALASYSLTGLVCAFNFALFVVFSKRQDWGALITGLLNVLIGIGAAMFLPSEANVKTFGMVFVQLLLQMFCAPFCGSLLSTAPCLQASDKKWAVYGSISAAAVLVCVGFAFYVEESMVTTTTYAPTLSDEVTSMSPILVIGVLAGIFFYYVRST